MKDVKIDQTLISPASGKMLKMPLNALRFLTMTVITVRCVVHKFSMNLCKHCPNK